MSYYNTLPAGAMLQGKSYTYRIERVLGQGSFGITYLATTPVKVNGPLGVITTNAQVAIKEFFMRDINDREGYQVTGGNSRGMYSDYKRKFVREADSLSKMDNRHIIKVLEAFESNNTAYYAMEYCEGGSLDELILQRGGLSESEARHYFEQIANALHYMHQRRMLHLDLKPGNIMLRSEGEAVLIDFGLSKQYTADGTPETSTTIGLGTPGYAPIEQAKHRDDSKTFAATLDVYALGATLYKMLTAERVPEASDIVNDGFPEERLQSRGVSAGLIRCIARAMALRSLRYPTVQAMATDMGIKLTDIPPETTYNHMRNEGEIEVTVIDVVGNTDDGATLLPNMHNGHEYVDLGLPSGLKWATCNVGARTPEDSGDYFAWGETSTKKEYTACDSSTLGKSLGDISGDSRYDAARKHWGGSWRMPTQAEMEELKDKCSWKWETQNGVKGYRVIGPNGNSIFLPASGCRYGSSLYYQGEYGYYWGSSPGESNTNYSYFLGFNSSFRSVDWSGRDFGHTVRPVSE